MQISELSHQTGVPVPRIKYYIREGLVPRGLSDPSSGGYDDGHVHRIRLVRAMVTVGGMSIANARAVLAEIDAAEPSVPAALGHAITAISSRAAIRDDENGLAAADLLDGIIAERGWQLAVDEPARRSVIDAIATMLDMGHADMLRHLDTYAQAAEQVADADVTCIADDDGLAVIVERSVLGTALGEIFLSGLRRLAHADRARRRFWPKDHK